ncbi:MAG: hypothetical protein NVV60_10080 [Luteimonas sp.]|nr:hypothetical protein [Luteimonas sp.]
MYALGRGVAQDCAVAASYLQPLASKGNEDAISWMERLLTPAGDAKELPPHVQADLLEAQALDALQRGDYPVFLSSLCAFEALGHAERLTAQDRTELLYHRAVALRATGKPKAALMALNAYLKIADSSSDNYQPALLMLRPLQEEARK